ncbi:MAG: hypothetical protein H6730_35830 [Deltaproteobacteria bacterium]|nr:hypothetical protein [Deltaproteobacteria bacterium]
MNDPLYRELSQLTLRYRWLIASVTVVVLAAALAQAVAAPPEYLTRVAVRPARVNGKPLTEVKLLSLELAEEILAARAAGRIPSDVEARVQIVRQDPPADIDLDLIAFTAKGLRPDALPPVVMALVAHLEAAQAPAVAKVRARNEASDARQLEHLAALEIVAADPKVHEAAGTAIVDLGRRARTNEALSTHGVEVLYGPHTFPQPIRSRLLPFGALGLAAGLVLGYLMAFFLAGFRARYREAAP